MTPNPSSSYTTVLGTFRILNFHGRWCPSRTSLLVLCLPVLIFLTCFPPCPGSVLGGLVTLEGREPCRGIITFGSNLQYPSFHLLVVINEFILILSVSHGLQISSGDNIFFPGFCFSYTVSVILVFFCYVRRRCCFFVSWIKRSLIYNVSILSFYHIFHGWLFFLNLFFFLTPKFFFRRSLIIFYFLYPFSPLLFNTVSEVLQVTYGFSTRSCSRLLCCYSSFSILKGPDLLSLQVYFSEWSIFFYVFSVDVVRVIVIKNFLVLSLLEFSKVFHIFLLVLEFIVVGLESYFYFITETLRLPFF